jgi:TonB C terminal
MIPRTLVPVNVRPVTKDEAKNRVAHRLTTYMDDRTVVPSGVSEAPPLDGKTNIPAHLPLGVLVDRTLVPRSMPATPLEKLLRAPSYIPLDIVSSRTVVPSEINPLTAADIKEFERPVEMTEELRAIVKPDIFTTGDANLLIEPEEKTDKKSDFVTRVLSVAVHIALIVFLIFAPKLFPAHVPTQDELEMARKELNFVYMPPEKPEPAPPIPKYHMDSKTLNRVAPPIEHPQIPSPVTPERPQPELPEAPKPRISVTPEPTPAQPSQPQPSRLEPVLPASPQSHVNIGLPTASPGRILDNQVDDAIRNGRGHAPVYGGGPPGPRGGSGGIGNGAEILSDTQGVDFNPYITRLLATLKRNWLAVMPESARWDKGVVFTTFQINPDGSVSAPDPTLERTSGKEPLDNAAMSAIHASNPFEPLPAQFHGPFLKLRIAFIYNIPPDQVDFH